jgi:hypothetical protein
MLYVREAVSEVLNYIPSSGNYEYKGLVSSESNCWGVLFRAKKMTLDRQPRGFDVI